MHTDRLFLKMVKSRSGHLETCKSIEKRMSEIYIMYIEESKVDLMPHDLDSPPFYTVLQFSFYLSKFSNLNLLLMPANKCDQTGQYPAHTQKKKLHQKQV